MALFGCIMLIFTPFFSISQRDHPRNLYQAAGMIWCSSGDPPAFAFHCGDGKANKGIHQCAHWSMHTPPACADMIRIPAG